MLMDLSRRLTHFAVWERTTNVGSVADGWNDLTQVTTSGTIACYAFQDVGGRILGNPGHVGPSKWLVVLGVERTDVQIGQVLRDIKDKQGNLLVSFGRIEDRQIYNHHEEVRCVQVVLANN